MPFSLPGKGVSQQDAAATKIQAQFRGNQVRQGMAAKGKGKGKGAPKAKAKAEAVAKAGAPKAVAESACAHNYILNKQVH